MTKKVVKPSQDDSKKLWEKQETNRKKETLPFATIWMDLEGQGNRKNLVKWYKLSVTRWISPEGPMYNTMTIADDTTLYN